MRRSQKKAPTEGEVLLYLLSLVIGAITFFIKATVAFITEIILFIGKGIEHLINNPIALFTIGTILIGVLGWWGWQKYNEKSGKLQASISAEIIIGLADGQAEYHSLTGLVNSETDALVLINKRIQEPLWRRSERRTKLMFEFTPSAKNRFELLQQGFKGLANSRKLWKVFEEQQTWDFKRHAGASTLLQRRKFSFSIKPLPYLFINQKIYSVMVGKARVFFMPDNIYIFSLGSYKMIPYSKIHINVSASRFVEEGEIPSDAEIIDYTWQYMRKDGGPDLRFKSNRQIPVALYGQVEFLIPNYFTLKLHISSLQATKDFGDSWLRFMVNNTGESEQKKYSSGSDDRSSNSSQQESTKSTKTPFEVLGIFAGVSDEEITNAYRKMAKMYHPDKVADMAPEIQLLAETRMKEINVAYEALKQKR